MSDAVALLLPDTIELCNAMMAGQDLAGMPGGLGVIWPMPPPPSSVPLAALLVMVQFCTLTVVDTIAKLHTNMPPPAAPATFPEMVELRTMKPLLPMDPRKATPPP